MLDQYIFANTLDSLIIIGELVLNVERSIIFLLTSDLQNDNFWIYLSFSHLNRLFYYIQKESPSDSAKNETQCPLEKNKGLSLIHPLNL
jgi:hypothetical protein